MGRRKPAETASRDRGKLVPRVPSSSDGVALPGLSSSPRRRTCGRLRLLCRFEGPRQIEFALPNSQALAAAGGVPSGVGCAFGSGSMTWRVVWDWEVGVTVPSLAMPLLCSAGGSCGGDRG